MNQSAIVPSCAKIYKRQGQGFIRRSLDWEANADSQFTVTFIFRVRRKSFS